MDVATMDDLVPGAQSLSNGKTWLAFAKKINAITLFGKGFDDLMVSEENRCYTKVPSGQELLAVPLSLLQEIREYRRGKRQPLEIAEGFYWSASEEAFTQCKPSCRQNHNNLLQTFQSSASSTQSEYALGSKRLEKHVSGAVFFGKPGKFANSSKDSGLGSSIHTPTPTDASIAGPSTTSTIPENTSNTGARERITETSPSAPNRHGESPGRVEAASERAESCTERGPIGNAGNVSSQEPPSHQNDAEAPVTDTTSQPQPETPSEESGVEDGRPGTLTRHRRLWESTRRRTSGLWKGMLKKMTGGGEGKR